MARARRIDIIAAISLFFIIVGAAASVISGSPRFTLVKESFFTGLFGLAFFASLLAPRPLMFYIVQEFDSIYMTTQGGPGTASTNLPFLIYQVAFAKKDVGEASALGVIVVILTIIAVQYLLKVLTSLTEGD